MRQVRPLCWKITRSPPRCGVIPSRASSEPAAARLIVPLTMCFSRRCRDPPPGPLLGVGRQLRVTLWQGPDNRPAPTAVGPIISPGMSDSASAAFARLMPDGTARTPASASRRQVPCPNDGLLLVSYVQLAGKPRGATTLGGGGCCRRPKPRRGRSRTSSSWRACGGLSRRGTGRLGRTRSGTGLLVWRRRDGRTLRSGVVGDVTPGASWSACPAGTPVAGLRSTRGGRGPAASTGCLVRWPDLATGPPLSCHILYTRPSQTATLLAHPASE